jgi:hypothetical protein
VVKPRPAENLEFPALGFRFSLSEAIVLGLCRRCRRAVDPTALSEYHRAERERMGLCPECIDAMWDVVEKACEE